MTRLLPTITPIPALLHSPAPTAADTRFARLSQSSIAAILRHAHAMPFAATVPKTEYTSAVNRAPVSLSEGAELAPTLGDPGFDYAALRLPLTLDDATAILGRYYRLGRSG